MTPRADGQDPALVTPHGTHPGFAVLRGSHRPSRARGAFGVTRSGGSHDEDSRKLPDLAPSLPALHHPERIDDANLDGAHERA